MLFLTKQHNYFNTYTFDWREFVWKNKETNWFKDITDEKYANYFAYGYVYGQARNGKDISKVEFTSGTTGNNTD